jgi:DNA polymerase III subunit alpha
MTLPASFTHLHVHSHYSLLRATPSVEQLVGRAVAAGWPALALTDSNALHGAVALRRACRAAGLKPIIGMTVAVGPLAGEVPLAPTRPGQLVLLAQNEMGYRSLCRLASLAQTADRPQGVGWDELQAHVEGLICLTGGAQGWLERYIRAGKRQAAVHCAARLGNMFEENCYVSVARDARGRVDKVGQTAVSLGERFGLRPVAVHPVYNLTAAERERLALLRAIDHNCPLSEVSLDDLPAESHWLDADDLADRYADLPEALANVAQIVERCEASLPDGRTRWPSLSLLEGETAASTMQAQSEAGLMRLYGPEAEVAGARLAQELAVIGRFGFEPLFLLVADITRFARREGIPFNTRGSVANSLAAYCLGITNVDPIAHNLLFERFLNPARASLPDIDLDFCSRRRDEVLHYVRRRYGPERVALVATISTMQPKSAVGETAKAYGLAPPRQKALAALFPRHWHPDPRRREGPDLAEVVAGLDDEREKTAVLAAFDLIGQPHHLSIHPGGIVITPGPLTDLVPVQMAAKGFLITQYDHSDLEAIGLPKIDLLGIRALTVLAAAADLIGGNADPDFRLTEIPLADEKTAALLSRGETIAVFQCESTGAQRTLRQLQAQNVRDLAVANAFFKPGPATGGMAAAFVRRYRGQEAVTFLHPALEPILAPTQGVLLFQEQVLRVATEVAGLSWAQADRLRHGMSKFAAREMRTLRLEFLLGCQAQSGLTPPQADTLWEQVMAFAGYGFNQGHATAYADVSYRSAYLKAHYPAQFLAARLAVGGGFHHAAVYLAEAQRLGIGVCPPHVNVSGRRLTLTEGETGPVFWLGLRAVRDLRRASVAEIVAQRPFSDLPDLLNRVTLSAKEVDHLIRCGALDGLGESRARLLAQAEPLLRAGSARQMAFGFATETAVAPDTQAQRLAWERELLGLPLSAHPLTLLQIPPAAVPLNQLAQQPGRRVQTAGVRLPGWTGGRGVWFSDGTGLVVVVPGPGLKKGDIPLWQPLLLNGRWVPDRWGGGWFAAERTMDGGR